MNSLLYDVFPASVLFGSWRPLELRWGKTGWRGHYLTKAPEHTHHPGGYSGSVHCTVWGILQVLFRELFWLRFEKWFKVFSLGNYLDTINGVSKSSNLGFCLSKFVMILWYCWKYCLWVVFCFVLSHGITVLPASWIPRENHWWDLTACLRKHPQHTATKEKK